MTRIGAQLRALREERGERLEDVAAGTFRSISSISRLESGERLPSDSLIDLMALHFKVDRNELSELVRDDLRRRSAKTMEKQYPSLGKARSRDEESASGLSARGRSFESAARSWDSPDMPLEYLRAGVDYAPTDRVPYEMSVNLAQQAIDLASTHLRALGESHTPGIRLRQLTMLVRLAEPLLREIDQFIENEPDPEVRRTAIEMRKESLRDRDPGR